MEPLSPPQPQPQPHSQPQQPLPPPEKFVLAWNLSFIDDELSEVPQRENSYGNCYCCRMADQSNYRVFIKFDTKNPHHIKSGSLIYGLRLRIAFNFLAGTKINSVSFLNVNDVPPNTITQIQNNTIQTSGYMWPNDHEIRNVPVTYVTQVIKNTHILEEIQIVIPTAYVIQWVNDVRLQIHQLTNGI